MAPRYPRVPFMAFVFGLGKYNLVLLLVTIIPPLMEKYVLKKVFALINSSGERTSFEVVLQHDRSDVTLEHRIPRVNNLRLRNHMRLFDAPFVAP